MERKPSFQSTARGKDPNHVNPPPNTDPDKRKVYTAEEVEQQLAFVEQLMTTPGVSEAQSITLCRQRFGFARIRFQNLKKRVQARWEQQDAFDRPSYRASAMRRITSMLQHARGKRTADGLGWEREPDHRAAKAWESLLADIQGTRAPIAITVHQEVATALVDVIGNLDPDQLQDCLNEYNETRRMAAEGRALLNGKEAAE